MGQKLFVRITTHGKRWKCRAEEGKEIEYVFHNVYVRIERKIPYIQNDIIRYSVKLTRDEGNNRYYISIKIILRWIQVEYSILILELTGIHLYLI